MNNNLIKFLLKLKNASLSRKETAIFSYNFTSSKIVENIWGLIQSFQLKDRKVYFVIRSLFVISITNLS
jgi:hypothetical protein